MTSPAWATRGGTAAEAVAALPSGANVFLQGAAATPTPLVDALVARTDLTGVRVYHLHTIGTAPLFAPAVSPWLRSVSFFVGPDARVAVAEGRLRSVSEAMAAGSAVTRSRDDPTLATPRAQRPSGTPQTP